jgi:hypothetical protein
MYRVIGTRRWGDEKKHIKWARIYDAETDDSRTLGFETEVS